MTNKSNILIALSPYFIPFWSAVLISLHSFVSLWWDIPAGGLILTGLLGFTWTFHIIWTVWMIPKDQPDLKENGTFFFPDHHHLRQSRSLHLNPLRHFKRSSTQ